jgi:hypothetical protein
MNNINVIEVGGKWSLPEWYRFCSEIFWSKKVFAIIDRDKNFEIDRQVISHTIKIVHKKIAQTINDFYLYNWIVLDWEFEHYYNVDIIKDFLASIIYQRAIKKFLNDFNQSKYNNNLKKLDNRLEKLIQTKKISHGYEVLFNKYFHRYGKPTIAFELSTWLSKNNGYKPELIDILKNIVIKIQK